MYDPSMEITTGSPNLKPSSYLTVSLIKGWSFGKGKLKKHSMQIRHEEDNHTLGFQDNDKMNGISDATLRVIVTSSI